MTLVRAITRIPKPAVKLAMRILANAKQTTQGRASAVTTRDRIDTVKSNVIRQKGANTKQSTQGSLRDTLDPLPDSLYRSSMSGSTQEQIRIFK